MTIHLTLRNVLLGLLVAVPVLLLLASAGVATWEYTNSDAFCANACHTVHPEEIFSHQQSYHAQVACVECHIGRMSFFPAAIEKSGHVTHAWAILAGYERPLTSPSLPAASVSCEGCHTANTHRANPVRVTRRFAPDEKNSESKLTMAVRIVGREFGREPPRDVNWHASGAVRFIAMDPQQLNVRWVEATRRDGEKVIYEHVRQPLGEQEAVQADKKVMDCIDCHNRAGHYFRDPELVVDEALARGDLTSSFPFVKARVMELVNTAFDTEAEIRAAVEQAWADYREDFAGLAETDPEAWQRAQEATQARQEFVVQLITNSQFLGAEDISWRSFPDHNGHKYSPGCFRCHNGTLQTDTGTPVPVNCTNCHTIPLVTRNDQIPDNYLALVDRRKPRSHAAPDFMAGHMTQVNDSCAFCHGEVIQFGKDDKTFCANSGCHDGDWEYLGWDALQARQ
jgi:hypothetical protein